MAGLGARHLKRSSFVLFYRRRSRRKLGRARSDSCCWHGVFVPFSYAMTVTGHSLEREIRQRLVPVGADFVEKVAEKSGAAV